MRSSCSSLLFPRLERGLGCERPCPPAPHPMLCVLCARPRGKGTASGTEVGVTVQWSGDHRSLEKRQALLGPGQGWPPVKGCERAVTENASWNPAEVGTALRKGSGSPGTCCWGLRTTRMLSQLCLLAPSPVPPGWSVLAVAGGSDQLRSPSSVSSPLGRGLGVAWPASPFFTHC